MFIIKKFISLLLVFSLALSIVACGQKDNSSNNNSSSNKQEVVEKRGYNYITGKPFADGENKTERPVAVMIDNNKLALPQSGLESADLIYEMVTEGGITRLMAVYSSLSKVSIAGPVRSARDQFVQFVLPLNAVYVHIGTSIYANDMLNFYHYQDIDGLYLGVTSFDFDKAQANYKPHEHCWYTKSNLIQDGINATAINTAGNLYPAFNFADYKKGPVEFKNAQDATEISFRFSHYADAAMHYNANDGKYYKDSFGAPQMDKETGTQVSFDNFFLLNTTVSLYPDGLCTNFDLSQGAGYYFYGGKYIPIKWRKGLPENPLVITDENDKVIEINPGKSYVAIIDSSMLEHLSIGGAVQEVEQNSEIQNPA